MAVLDHDPLATDDDLDRFIGFNAARASDEEVHSRLIQLQVYERPSLTQRREMEYLQNLIRERHVRREHIQGIMADPSRSASHTEGVANDRIGYDQPVPGPAPSVRESQPEPGYDPRAAQFRSAALRTIERYANRNVLSAHAADRVDAVLRGGDPNGLTARYIAAVGNEHYASAFARMLADPAMGHLRYTPAEVEAVREAGHAEAACRAAILTSTTGVPLPLTVDPSIVLTGTGALNPIRDIADVIVVGTHDWLGVASDGVTASYVQEGTEATDATPALVGPRISTQQGRAFCQYTIESSQDWPTLASQLVQLIDDARSVLDATKWLTGTGTNEPSGILNIGGTNGLTTAQRVQTATVAAYAVGDPWLLKAAIPARFIASTTFAAAPGTWDTTYRFVAQGSTTEPRQFADGDRGGDFLGRPKVEWSPMATGATTGTKLIIGGGGNPASHAGHEPAASGCPRPLCLLAFRVGRDRSQRVPVLGSQVIRA